MWQEREKRGWLTLITVPDVHWFLVFVPIEELRQQEKRVESCVHRITSRVRGTEALLLVVVVVASLLRVALLSKESLNSKGFLDIKLFTGMVQNQ